ncbi:zinc finger MYM-type protein 1 [Trichonephila clavipes]|nr:zinc finger MYM-type protein 1 [Trichonephila clavipes]
MLAQNCLALRGTSDKLYDFSNGIFLQIIQLLAQFDSVMDEHLRKVLKKEEVKVHYLGKEIQNELITLLGENITSHIIGEIKKAKYYSVILDCTLDISKTEQMTVLVRYVSIDKSNPKEVSIKINKSFLGLLPVERLTGYELSTLILKGLEILGLNLQDMRGQAFDNGANMRGNKSGVQSRINALNPRAFYLPYTPQNDVLKYCKDLETVLTDGNSSDINALDMADEIVAVLALLNKKESPIEILKFMSNLDFAPNLGIVLRILFTLSISVASGERSFSKLKLIKKFLRSTTTEDRLNGLATIAIEHELAEEIDVKEIIKKFSELKVRKKHF